MGDLKKKAPDYVINEETNLESVPDMKPMQDDTVERLRVYMKEFYEIQKNKLKDE